jgi:hypothetical protein
VGDVDGVFRLVDRAGGELLGWTSAELLCAPHLEWVHPDDRDALVESADTVCGAQHGGRYWPVEMRILARDRHYWWTRWHVWVSGDPPVACASAVDYVERDADVGPPVGTWRWDVDADSVVWSPELLDMFALGIGPPADYERFLAGVHAEDRDEVDRAVRWSLLSGEPYVADFRAFGECEGRDRWFHAAGRVEPAANDLPGQLCGIVKYLNPPNDAHRAT